MVIRTLNTILNFIVIIHVQAMDLLIYYRTMLQLIYQDTITGFGLVVQVVVHILIKYLYRMLVLMVILYIFMVL